MVFLPLAERCTVSPCSSPETSFLLPVSPENCDFHNGVKQLLFNQDRLTSEPKTRFRNYEKHNEIFKMKCFVFLRYQLHNQWSTE